GLTLLHTYATRGDMKQVRRVLKCGAEVDFACHAGWTPLHEAAGKEFVEVVEELCRYGSVVDARGRPFGVTPLMDAAAVGHAGAVRVLLEFGTNLDAKDSEGKMALNYAEGEEVKELLRWPSQTWKPPLRTPDFIQNQEM
ncbi:ankyrin repeat-containing domain protein, partial [Chytriomyces sp. MP71]